MLKDKRGISLTTMVITVLIMLLIMGTLVYSAVDSVKMRKLNKLYNDLRQLGDAVEVYYLKNGALPIDTSRTGGSSIVVNGFVQNVRAADTRDEVKEKGLEFILRDDATAASNQNNLVNPNDFDTSSSSATYYFIKVGLLENITLNYPDNEYIVNAQSHAVYNYTGVTINKVAYHSLPLTYKDINYKENNAVTAIALKGVTNIANGTHLYVPYSLNSFNIRDYLVFNSSAGTGLGEPKTVTFGKGLGFHSYYDLNPATGELYKTNSSPANVSDTNEDTVTVYTTSYNGSIKNATFTIHYADINVHNIIIENNIETMGAVVDTVILATKHTESTYIKQKTEHVGILEKQGVLYNRQFKTTTITTDNEVAYGEGNETNSDKVKVLSGAKAGTATITYEAQSYGYTKDTITAKVYDFKVYKGDGGSNTNITKIDFDGVGALQSENYILNVSGPDEITWGQIVDGVVANDITWSEVERVVDANNNNSVTYQPYGTNPGIIRLEDHKNDANNPSYIKATITPLKIGTTYLKCEYKVNKEVLGTIIIPVTVRGEITATGLNDTDIIALTGSTKSVVLTYTLDEAITTGATVMYTASVGSNSNFTATQDATDKNKFTVTYTGTSEISIDATITATVTKNGVETKYSDKIKITYGT